jgi:hypothetical protein
MGRPRRAASVSSARHVTPLAERRAPSAERRTRIVFIVRDITDAEVRGALRVLRSFEPS